MVICDHVMKVLEFMVIKLFGVWYLNKFANNLRFEIYLIWFSTKKKPWNLKFIKLYPTKYWKFDKGVIMLNIDVNGYNDKHKLYWKEWLKLMAHPNNFCFNVTWNAYKSLQYFETPNSKTSAHGLGANLPTTTSKEHQINMINI